MVAITQESAKKALYCKSIKVTYSTSGIPTDPNITFNDGSVFVNQALDLNTLFTSNSSGAVTYSITSGGSFATLSGSTLTGVAVGSVTVKASQAATSSYNAGEATATIAVTEYVQPTEFDVALNNVAFGCGIGNNAEEQSFTINNTEFVAGCSSSASSKTYYDANHVRFYDGSYLNITAPEGYIITNTVFTADGNWYGGISVNSGIYNNDTKTWEGGTDQLNFSFTAQNRISSVAITLAVPGAEYTITYANLTNGSFAEGNPTSASAGVPVTVLTIPDEGYCLASMTYNDGTTTENATVNGNSGTFTMPEQNVNVSATFSALNYTNYELVSSMSELVSGKHYIIVSENERFYAMGSQNTNNRAAVEINVNNGIASVSNIDPVREFVINGPDADGFYTIYDAEQPGYLYAAGGSGDNYLKTQTLNNEKGQWTISFDAENHDANIVANTSGSNKMRFNSSSSIFSCYASGQSDIFLYVKEGDTNYEFYKDIAKYSDNNPGWYFIASPVASVTPTANNGILTEHYDLYRFNQAADKEWQNHKIHNFNIESGYGYLYASSVNTTLVFAGTPYSGNGEVTLYKTDNAEAEFAGWNLVGNPFSSNAKVSKAFYKMNSTSDGINANPYNANSVIASMEGVFVLAAQDQEKVTFTATTDAVTVQQSRSISLDVNRNGEMLDRAIVSFNAEGSLSKLVLSENTTKLYFRQGQKDYAIVASDNENEMPVSFKASRNGSYTLTVNTEELEMNYLHLIDNMTGMDVDLLQTPSYTFDATTNDYASRFRLVFSANNVDGPSTGSEAFAFYSNGNWVVSNEGEATLQVIDVNGRIVSNETINGTVATSINATPGVYMLRLVNGNEVKTQKIVVK